MMTPKTEAARWSAVDRVDTVSHVNAAANPSTLAAALAGDAVAWRSIVDEHTKLLWWVARRHRLDDATAADVIQTVWLQLLRFGDRIEDPARLPAWLATTARRESLRRVGNRVVPTDNLADEVDRSAPSTEERVLDAELRDGVLAAFSKLSPDDQQLLRLLCEVPPKTYEEIAVILGKSHGYVGPTRQRALERLRKIVREMGLS